MLEQWVGLEKHKKLRQYDEFHANLSSKNGLVEYWKLNCVGFWGVWQIDGDFSDCLYFWHLRILWNIRFQLCSEVISRNLKFSEDFGG